MPRKLLIVTALAVLGTLLGAASAAATVRTYTYKFGSLGVGPYQAVKASNDVEEIAARFAAANGTT